MLCFLVVSLFASAQRLLAESKPASQEAIRRAHALLERMTVEEKVGQLNLVSIRYSSERTRPDDEAIIQGKVGGILHLADPTEIDRLQHLAVEHSRLHIPILFGLDAIHGYDTMFPIPLAMASSWDPSMEESAQAFAASEARAAGIRWTMTPMVDIARDARWGRIREGAGEDPYLGSLMAKAQVLGFQGQSLGPNSVVACVKHFAGYGAADGGRDYDSSYVPEVLLRNVYLKPFHAAVAAGVGCLMSAYMDLDDVPASGNRWLLTDVLRKEWRFRGFITSDDKAIANLQTHGYASSPADAAFKAIAAGAGMDLGGQTFINNLPKLIAEGKVTEPELDAAVLPILAIKYQIGLFDHPYVDSPKAADASNHVNGIALTRSVAARSMVLLKNEQNTLPLTKGKIRRVAVIGYLANSGVDTQGGLRPDWQYLRVAKHPPVTILSALKAQIGSDAQITYVAGPGLPRMFPSKWEIFTGQTPVRQPTMSEVRDWLKKTRAAASNADVVIAVLGELASMSGEESSRASLSLPGIQEQMLEAAATAGKPIVVVLINGRPLDIRWAYEHVSAILEAWLPGTEGGNAVADILFGNVNPGGKLPVTWPRSAGQEPLYYNHNLTQHPDSDPGFTSLYWDLSSSPLYHFGYGLSYTTFKFSNLRLTNRQIKIGDGADILVDVTNTGARPGDAVGQLYIHARAGTGSRPKRQLAGFRRITLEPGETRTLEFPLGKDDLSFWSPQTKVWTEEGGVFDIWVGDDSAATLATQLVVTQ
ncbi:MAG: beta-glucosidase BglX [Acidobacteriaceae bacterium]